MPSCKYCSQSINWLNNNGKYTPLNAADGSVHQCQKRPPMQQQNHYQQSQPQTYNTQPQHQQPQIDMSEITRRLDAIMSKCLQLESMVKNCMPYTPLDEPVQQPQ